MKELALSLQRRLSHGKAALASVLAGRSSFSPQSHVLLPMAQGRSLASPPRFWQRSRGGARKVPLLQLYGRFDTVYAKEKLFPNLPSC